MSTKVYFLIQAEHRVVRTLVFLLLLFVQINAMTQEGVTTFGIQYNPIIPNRLIGMYSQDFVDTPMVARMQQKFGNHFGGIVRHGFTKNFSMETGLSFTQRNFNLFYEIEDSGFSEKNDVRIPCYSVPLSGLVFIRLGDQFYMNTSLGVAMTLYPSAVQVFTEVTNTNYHFLMEAVYKSKVQGALLANLGFEYRTEKSGYLYFGATYNLPFAPICAAALGFEYSGGDFVAVDWIPGSFLTLDLRYYFNEAKEKRFGENRD